MDKQQIIDGSKKLAQEQKTAFLMATVTAEGKPRVRWMGGLALEEPYTIYLVTCGSSRKVAEILSNPNTELLFNKPDFTQLCAISGLAEVEKSDQIKKWVWEQIPACADYFQSPESEDFCVLKVDTKRIEFIAEKDQHEPETVEL